MELASHCGNLSAVRNHVSWRRPNGRANQENEQHPLRVRHEAFCPWNPAHPHPEVVITREEEDANQEGLHDPKPAHEAAHHCGAHLLVVLVDLTAKPVAGEGEHDERADRDEIPDVAHPVVMGTLLISLR